MEQGQLADKVKELTELALRESAMQTNNEKALATLNARLLHVHELAAEGFEAAFKQEVIGACISCAIGACMHDAVLAGLMLVLCLRCICLVRAVVRGAGRQVVPAILGVG
jgi:hypothetical protein